jgi:16S rRNA (cytosine967-C5)-methyltransferase
VAEIDSSGRRPADAVANDFFRDRRYIGSADRRAISERVWGVLRGWRRLNWWLGHANLVATPPLIVAASLLLDGWTMESVTQHFTGGQYAPDKIGPTESARLLKLQGGALTSPRMDEATRLELPYWLIPPLRARFGDTLEAEIAALERPAPLDLRVNLLKGTREDAIEALRQEGLDAEPTPLSAWGLRIEGRKPVTSGAAFRTGLVEIQDEGSQLLAALVEARPDMRVLDYCAGAGGKTLAMAMTMENRGHIVACDVSAPRLDSATRRLRRAGVHNVERHLLEPGDKWAKRRAASFDRVLVDAPCTGTGTWRRNPDARLRLSQQDLAELLPKQAAILQTAAALVKPGGRLIYATCSLLAFENEDQVAAFLERNPAFQQTGTLSLTPHQHNTDGFFGAVLERTA